jgi:hypothetical protein
MKRLCMVMALAALAGCGADGEPVRPSMSATVGAGSDGLSAATGMTLTKGPVTLGWGAGA